MRNTTTITVRGDAAYRTRLKKLAALQEQDMADLTRFALDKVFGDGIADPEGISLSRVVSPEKQSSSGE